MAAELEADLGIRAEMLPGDKGVFDVKVDDVLVFSKHSIGRFPTPGEVVKIVEARRGGSAPSIP